MVICLLYDNLHIDDNFFDRYEDHREKSESYTQAYWKTEREHIELYGIAKYSGFKSFNAAYNRKRARLVK